MRKVLVLAVLFGIVVGVIDGHATVRGEISDVQLVQNELTRTFDWQADRIANGVRVAGSVTIPGFHPFAKAWIGCTVRVRVLPGVSEDIQVWDLEAQWLRAGEFDVVLNLPNMRGAEVVGYTVALWEERVEGCGCEYCRRNGYHLAGQVDRYSHNWN